MKYHNLTRILFISFHTLHGVRFEDGGLGENQFVVAEGSGRGAEQRRKDKGKSIAVEAKEKEYNVQQHKCQSVEKGVRFEDRGLGAEGSGGGADEAGADETVGDESIVAEGSGGGA